MAEIWKKIKYFENYEISNLGKVRNVKTKRLLSVKPTKSHKHPQVFLYLHKFWKEQKTVSHLVWEHFGPCPQSASQYYKIRHKDNNIFNNNINNLAVTE